MKWGGVKRVLKSRKTTKKSRSVAQKDESEHETSTKAFIGAILMLIMGSTILCLAERKRKVWEDVGTLLQSLPGSQTKESANR
jgi:hypothetical protein